MPWPGPCAAAAASGRSFVRALGTINACNQRVHNIYMQFLAAHRHGMCVCTQSDPVSRCCVQCSSSRILLPTRPNAVLYAMLCYVYSYSALTDCHAFVDVGHVAILLEMRRMIVHIAYRDIHIALGAEQPIVGLHIFSGESAKYTRGMKRM